MVMFTVRRITFKLVDATESTRNASMHASRTPLPFPCASSAYKTAAQRELTARQQLLTVHEHVVQSMPVAEGSRNDRGTSFLQAIQRASAKRRSRSPVAYLETPEVLAQILPDLHLNIVFRNAVLSESLARKAFSQLQPKRELSC